MTRNSSSTPATNPATPSSDPVSEAAPGVRTEAEVLADEQAAADAAANAAPPGVTGNPLINAEIPDEEDDSKLVHYERESDGTVQSVNVGSDAHAILESGAEWSKTTRAKAVAASKKADA
jgi:hypothetical protein